MSAASTEVAPEAGGKPAPAQPERLRPWLKFALVALAIACAVFIVAGALLSPFLWGGVANGYLQSPVFGDPSSIAAVIQEIGKLEARYASAVAGLHGFKNSTSMLALVVAAAAGAAGVLRAPQALTVSLSGIAAVIYGVQSLFFNQATMTGLVDAQVKLACIESASSAFLQTDRQQWPQMPALLGKLAGALPAVQDQLGELGVRLSRLDNAVDEMKRSGPDHLRRIDAALSRPGGDYLGSSSRLQSAVGELSETRQLAARLKPEDRVRFQAELGPQLDQANTELRQGIEVLAQPGTLRAGLARQREDYDQGLLDAADAQQQGRRIEAAAAAAVDGATKAEQALQDYATQRQKAAAAVADSASVVHSALLEAMAQSELSPEAIRNLITALVGDFSKAELPQGQAVKAEEAQQYEPSASVGMGAPPYSAPSSALEPTLAAARLALRGSREALAATAAARLAAVREAAALQAVERGDAAVLAAGVSRLGEAGGEVNRGSQDLDRSGNSLNVVYQQARAGLAEVDFPRMLAELRDCTNTPASALKAQQAAAAK